MTSTFRLLVAQNHFFTNKSSKQELIGTKFYRETSAHVAHSSANFWCPMLNGRKMAAKNPLCNHFCY